MIKIAALNEELEEDSDSEEEVTKEALEQIALQQYNKALDLQRKGNLPEATELLKDLLDTELLYDVKKPLQGEKTSGPLYNLKYLCYKNLASMLKTTGEIDAAIEAYTAASELDDTDVTLWHRMGLLCMQANHFEAALHAFQRGVGCNPHYWPCLDKIITLLLGLDYKEECISNIYEALRLDPGYLRGLVYRRYIFTDFPYVRRYMEYLDPVYKWDESVDGTFSEDYTTKFLNEATKIQDIFIEQQKAEQFKCVLPILKLKKPITNLTWSAVGDSLVYMHQYMTENCFSHACRLELVYEKEEIVEPMDVCEDVKTDLIDNKPEDTNTDTEKNIENVSENENNDFSDKDKATTDTEKVESDIEMATAEPTAETPPEPKKKQPVRRRGSVLRSLKQWGWCEPRSGRKKPTNKESNDNIYDILKRMVPQCLSPEVVQKKENQEVDIMQGSNDLELNESKIEENPELEKYFDTDSEQKDVEQFINTYIDSKHDIIDILKEYLAILASKWRVKWPSGLSKIFTEANKCYNNHIDIPVCTDKNKSELLHYTFVNMLVEEFTVNEKLNSINEVKQGHELNVIDTIGLCLTLKPHIFSGEDCLELMLRHLWVKLHINVLNKCDVLALECLYQLSYEFEAMGECCSTYCLNLVNFTLKPIINDNEISEYIKFLERNKKLSTVMELYERGSYEEVLEIIIDSFEHCKKMARDHEDEMSLDFSVQLSLILDTYWALGNVDDCFKWSLTCLHEALKHYFRYTSGSSDYERWTLTVVKVLCCMEHILTTEGLLCLEEISEKQMSQGLDDLIRIIGHQVETNSAEMPFGTIVPWIVMHYILQREEDQGRGRTVHDRDATDEIPNPLMVLFIAHEQLGSRGWCSNSDCKLLFFILDTVVPRLRSPYLSKSLEQISQYMEQCVYCLFGHPAKKNKIKYLTDHNITPQPLNWKTAQQLYEIFRPQNLPAIEGKVPAITSDTEQLFHRILALLPSEADPQKYLSDAEKYLKGQAEYLPVVQTPLPYKMRDIYFLLGDYYFKKEEGKMAIKFNMLDIILNNNRLESWAEISLAKAVNLDRILNSCKNLNNERDYLIPAKCIIRCFKRAVALDPTHCNMWIEYGIFVYTVHSFCSRLLKQASESLSMEDFESLEKQKEEMLDTTQTCFTTVLQDLNNSSDIDKENEDTWLNYYMLGKVAEKRNKPPSTFLTYYIKGVQSLQETSATYPSKINSSSPTHLCIEVLELHYRIHASILKYIEQHENKPIPASVGKVFSKCIEQWKNGPFSKKSKKDVDCDGEAKSNDPKTSNTEPVQAGNILKRSISDAGEEDTSETKRLRLEAAAAKVRRSASYDTERLNANAKENRTIEPVIQSNINKVTEATSEENLINEDSVIVIEENKNASDIPKVDDKTECEKQESEMKQGDDTLEKKEDNSSTSSSSSSDSSSSESSSDSSSESSRDSDTSANDARPLTEDEIMKIVGDCLDALEDCASRFSPHYKAIYRLCHYHFYYKKGKNIERCRDLMLSNFTTRSGQKLAGLFSERKHSNFFNNIWKILTSEVDRAGSFAFHMNRCVLLTMEILKEIDDHKTLLDLSLHLQRIPEPDKKYLRDSDREELAQQAFSLCVQSLKGQLVKFSQQADLKSNDVERQALKSLMLDIYRAYQRAQKQPNSKQFTNLLVDAYKLVITTPIAESTNLVDLSMKYCQSLIQTLRQQATQASLDKSQNYQKKLAAKVVEAVKAPVASLPKVDHKTPSTSTTTAPSLPKMSSHDVSAAFQSYLPMINEQILSQQTAAALSYLSNISAFAGYTSLQNSLQSSIQSSFQNSFQAEFYRQFLGPNLSSFGPPPVKKVKRGPKPGPRAINPQSKQSKPFRTSSMSSLPKSSTMSSALTSLQKSNSSNIPSSMSSIPKPVVPTPGIGNLQKSNAPTLAPSMGTVLSSLPASMTTGLSYGPSHPTQSSTNVHSTIPSQAHLSSASAVTAMVHSKPPPIHQQASPVKTLQEKLAERQKNLPLSKMNAQEINALNRLPASLTITKTGPSKQTTNKKPELKKALSFSEAPKPISSDEVIVLDDD